MLFIWWRVRYSSAERLQAGGFFFNDFRSQLSPGSSACLSARSLEFSFAYTGYGVGVDLTSIFNEDDKLDLSYLVLIEKFSVCVRCSCGLRLFITERMDLVGFSSVVVVLVGGC